jgi:RES domain-containing protein
LTVRDGLSPCRDHWPARFTGAPDASLVMPANQHFIEITIPNGVSYEIFQTAAHPGWDSRNETICKTFGRQWNEQQIT